MITKWICAILFSLLCVATAQAEYPTRPVKIILGFAPGTGADIITRLYARKLEEKLGQPFVVENHVGASGNLSTAMVARAEPDGYTLLSHGITATVSGSLFKNLKWDIIRDFEPVAYMGSAPMVVAVNPQTNINSLQELIAAAKAKPNEIPYASSGTGTALHMAVELFSLMSGAKLRHIPYRDNGQALLDLVAGRVSVMFPVEALVVPYKNDSRLKLLAVTSKRRSSLFPNLPSVSETPGLEKYDTAVWYGMFAPKGTPMDIVLKLNAAISEITEMPDVKEQLAKIGTETLVMSQEEYAAYVRQEVEKWAKVIKFSGIKIEQ